VGPCTYDVGFCPEESYEPANSKNPNLRICPRYENVSVDCGVFGTREVRVVTSCKCCGAGTLVVQETVHDYVDGIRLSATLVYYDGKVVARTLANSRYKRRQLKPTEHLQPEWSIRM